MRTKRFIQILLLSSFSLNSCVIIDTKPLGYTVKNCTNDTLLIDICETDTISDEIYWDTNPVDVPSDDTTTVCIDGKMVNIYNFFRVMPHTKSNGFYPLNGDTCYIHKMKWRIVTHFSWNEIRSKKMYNTMIVTKKDFDSNRIYEFKKEK